MSCTSLKLVRNAVLGIDKEFDLILHNGMKEYICTSGEIIGPLIREFSVIKYCISGRGKIIFDYGTFDIHAGQCFIVLPGQVVSEIADEIDPWRHTWLTVHGTRAESLFQDIGITPKNPLLPWDSNPEFLIKMHNAIDICTDTTASSELRRTAYAYLIFDFLNQYVHHYTSKEHEKNQSNCYIKEAIYYMEMNYANPIKVSDVAAHIGLNRSYFFSIFKEQLHLSPQEFLTQLRIKKACELFSYPDSTVTNVANSLNYEPSVFFRHFKRIVGYSPSQYKKLIASESGGSKP